MTLGIHDFGVFVASAIVLNLTPGQDTLYIVGRALAGGRRDGMAAALGVSTGTAIHSLAAAIGLSAIVAASDTVFAAMKFAGAAYLVWLGIGLLRSPASTAPAGAQAVTRNGAAFRQGVITNVANPKVALFFLAFLPQFVDAASPNRMLSLLALGATFVTTSTVWCIVLALGAARVQRTLETSSTAGTILQRLAGVLFVGLGIRLAVAER